MLESKWMADVADIMFAFFTVYLFLLYFGIFLKKKKKNIWMLVGLIVLVLWQMDIPNIIYKFPKTWSIGVTVGFTLFVVVSVFEGKLWMKVFFSVTFDAIWMLAEMLIGSLLLFYGKSITEWQAFGSFTSKILFLIVIVALRKVLTNEKILGVPPWHTILIVFIPMGSIYIMNAVFMLAYRTEWEYAGLYSLASGGILLCVNVLAFYLYIKLADDLQVRQMNMVYEKQLELCVRHQEETEISMMQVRDVRHSMRNHLLVILAYAEKGEREKLKKYVEDLVEGGSLEPSKSVNTGNIVMDSLVGYWKQVAENEKIKFDFELSIPMEMPFRGADISLIMGNLLENAMEGARKIDVGRYIRLKVQYNRKNLLISVENSYKGELEKGKDGELKTTKGDTANHGIGLPSVRRAVGKYQGLVFVDDTMAGRFVIRVVLYGLTAEGDEREKLHGHSFF